VVLDAGHGGGDGGTVVFGLEEADIVLDLALRAERLLLERGVRVVLTRRTDETMSLAQRVEVGRRNAGAIFVSLHANRFASSKVRGAEAYVSTPGQPVTMRLEPGDSGRPYRDGRSAELAKRLLREMGQQVGMPVRAVRESRFVVTREVQAPSVLLECGYLSNPVDAWLMSRAESREKMARAIADACVNYLADVKQNRLLGCTAWSGPDAVQQPVVEGPEREP
jgi:N-acetylmuramoyl-L-alanine amidase